MNLDQLFDALFPAGHAVTASGPVVSGTATVAGRTVAVIGTTGSPLIGLEEILALGDRLEDAMREAPGAPIVMLVDNSGQRMALREELLALAQYIANLAALTDQARRRGHRLLALVTGKASAGGFIAWGLCADRLYALPGADPTVMRLEAIARVTHMELSALEELAKTAPVFAPGVENFFKMGGFHEVWTDKLAERLEAALAGTGQDDDRAALGRERNGRTMARAILDRVENAVLD